MPDPREKGRRIHKVEGERFIYFYMRTLFTGILFLIITLITGVWQIRKLSDVLTGAFISLVILLILIYFFTGIAGRVIAFYLLRYISKSNKKTIQTFWNINSGINKMSIRWFFSVIAKSILFSLGVVVFLQKAIYGSETVLTLIGTYIIVECFVWLIFKGIFWRKG